MKKVWAVLKKIWKPVLIVGGAVVALIGGVAAVRAIEASIGRVQQPKNWTPVPNDPTKIAIVDTAGQAKTVSLPKDAKGKQLTSSEVAAAGLDAKGAWTVQVKAENVFGGQ